MPLDKLGYLLILQDWNRVSQWKTEVSMYLRGSRDSWISLNAKSFPFDLPFGSINNFHFKADPTMSTNRCTWHKGSYNASNARSMHVGTPFMGHFMKQ